MFLPLTCPLSAQIFSSPVPSRLGLPSDYSRRRLNLLQVMTRPRDIDDVQIVLLDQAIEMNINEV